MRRLVFVVLPVALAGCYSYTPLASPDPVAGTKVSLVLSDQGRVGMGPSIGAGAAKVDGMVVGTSDTAYLLSVSDVYGINGSHSPWVGETVQVQRAYVSNSLQRRFSRGRTLFAVGGAAAAIVGFLVTRNLLGIGGDASSGKLPPGPPDNQ